ncbi:MAG: hypothetical protein ACJ79A_07760 [Gemmatimonadaceae bacterium]
MLHTLLASVIVSASAHVTAVALPNVAPRVLLDTAVAAPVAKRLTLDLRVGGSVQIVGTQDKVVRIRVTENGRACGDCGVRLDQGNDGIQVHSTRPGTSGAELRFEIEVPEHFDLDVASAGGAVRIEGVDGSIKGLTESGALELRRLSGSVDLETKNGDVTLRESYVSGRVHTVGGRVLLEDVSGSVAGSSGKGKVIERRVQRG